MVPSSRHRRIAPTRHRPAAVRRVPVLWGRTLPTTDVVLGALGAVVLVVVSVALAVTAVAARHEAPPLPPDVLPAPLERIGARTPGEAEVSAILASSGYRGVRSFLGDVSGSAHGATVTVNLSPSGRATALGHSGVGTGQYAFRNEGPCTYYARPVPALVVEANRVDGCPPLDDPSWDFAREITARLTLR